MRDIYRSNVVHMLLLHHIITRLALLNLVTRQSRKLLQRYNSISGKSKSIRPARAAVRATEMKTFADSMLSSCLCRGNYILRVLLINSLSSCRLTGMHYRRGVNVNLTLGLR